MEYYCEKISQENDRGLVRGVQENWVRRCIFISSALLF